MRNLNEIVQNIRKLYFLHRDPYFFSRLLKHSFIIYIIITMKSKYANNKIDAKLSTQLVCVYLAWFITGIEVQFLSMFSNLSICSLGRKSHLKKSIPRLKNSAALPGILIFTNGKWNINCNVLIMLHRYAKLRPCKQIKKINIEMAKIQTNT